MTGIVVNLLTVKPVGDGFLSVFATRVTD